MVQMVCCEVSRQRQPHACKVSIPALGLSKGGRRTIPVQLESVAKGISEEHFQFNWKLLQRGYLPFWLLMLFTVGIRSLNRNEGLEQGSLRRVAAV